LFPLNIMYAFLTAPMLATCSLIWPTNIWRSWPQWPRGISRRSATTRLMRLWDRISPEASMSDCRECSVLLGRGLCDELITRPEESYWLWCVVVRDLETSWIRKPAGGCCAKHKPYMAKRLWRSSLCRFLHPPISSSVSGLNVSLSILFSYTTSLSCPYKITSFGILISKPLTKKSLGKRKSG